MNLILAEALPSPKTGYVFAAYAVVFLLLLIYIWILAAKYRRLNRELIRVNERLEALSGPHSPEPAGPEPGGDSPG